jgi:hypothetical protein
MSRWGELGEAVDQIDSPPSRVNSGRWTLMLCMRYFEATRNGEPVRYARIVIRRQRPGTASGVVFMTLEDETGFVHVGVRGRVFEEHVVLIRTWSFLASPPRSRSGTASSTSWPSPPGTRRRSSLANPRAVFGG